MNFKSFVLFSILLLFASCSNEVESDKNIVIAGKNLSSITHVFYNYVYPDQPATRTFTTEYILSNNQINYANTSIFHYWHEEPNRNYTAYDESVFYYDNRNRLIKVDRESYSENDLTNKYFNTFEFDYEEGDKLKNLILKDGNGDLLAKYLFFHQNNTVEQKYEFYDDGNLIFYNQVTFFTDGEQRIYHQISNGPFFDNTDPNSLTETTQEANFNEEGNVSQTLFNGNPSEEYEYSDKKIPSDLPNIQMPFLGYIPYDILLAQLDQIVQSYNTNYITSILSLETTNQYTKTFKNTLSKDDYPLKIEIFYNDKIRSETIYTYE